LTPEGKVEVEPSRERMVVLKEDSLRKASRTEGPRLPPAWILLVVVTLVCR
jgi:hypothetical protein